MFCALTLCEQEPCLFGQCQLTATGYRCHCQPGYTGANCEQKQRPCADNPCEGRGEMGLACLWPRCERRIMNIPFKPLSERMLQEPFWLGLITVTVVLAFIGLVWCAKRHLPEKLEKLLAEEADRNRPSGFAHSRPPSVREQLRRRRRGGGGVGPRARSRAARAPLGRLGIRANLRFFSVLSSRTPRHHRPATAHGQEPLVWARFALNAAKTKSSLRAMTMGSGWPGDGTPSPRKKRNNSTPTKKSLAEKNQILKQLVTPSANPQRPRKVSLGELIQLSERKLKEAGAAADAAAAGADRETTFSSASAPPVASCSLPASALLLAPRCVKRVARRRRASLDGKLEKKVTFARLLSKVSAEMSSGSEAELGLTRHAQLSGLPRSASTPPSPAADQRSPHSTSDGGRERGVWSRSSNQGSDSLSSLDVTSAAGAAAAAAAMNDLLAARRPSRLLHGARPPKNPSADSILAMFRTFSAAGADPRLSPSTTPTASSPQDDVAGSDESTASSVPTPLSSSCSLTLDSPPTHHALRVHGGGGGSTIEVPVLDALSAHKGAAGGGYGGGGGGGLGGGLGGGGLHPPSILLEVPSVGGGGFLSPIREVPTPLATPAPSPALTPVMPRSSVM
ncbi:Putative CTL10 isoform A, partial [Gryllus bimaculatus]